ncbi:30S ribosomal protein S8 [Candidatus Woesearchaeota archaeon]|nr:30S ribosomal protein S8 [Candidatus Woesearchaeota archaeon]
MSMNDTLAAVLSHINNYEQKNKPEVLTKYSSKIIKKVLDLLQRENYIAGYEEIEDSKGNLLRIYLNGNINRVGAIKPRFAVKATEYEKFEKRYLPAKGFGILIVSTVKGLMTHYEAKQQGLGGRLIAYCY